MDSKPFMSKQILILTLAVLLFAFAIGTFVSGAAGALIASFYLLTWFIGKYMFDVEVNYERR